MRFLTVMAMAGALIAGTLGLSANEASAAPLAAGAMPLAKAESGLVTKAQYYDGRPAYRPYRTYRPYRPVVRIERPYRPLYRAYNPYRPVTRAYRPYRPIYRGYRPVPRVVCRTRFRTVRTAYGFVRRPVQVCTRRF